MSCDPCQVETPNFGVPSNCGSPRPASGSCSGRSLRRPISRSCSQGSFRSGGRRTPQLVSRSNSQLCYDDAPCPTHPRNDCCIPCCPPQLPKCPTGVYVEKVQPIRPDRYYEPPTIEFDGVTTYREHYHPKCGSRAQSFKPHTVFDPSCAKLSGITSYKEAYTPKPSMPYRKPAWAKQAEFSPSCGKMDGTTTYRYDYKGCMGDRVASFKPLSQFDPSTASLDGKTTYKVSFIPYCPREYRYAKQPTARHYENSEMSCAPIDGLSTYRADFWPKCGEKRNSMKPTNKARFSNAKFADRTTYKNDFNPFTFQKCVEPCIPAEIFEQQPYVCGCDESDAKGQ